AKKSRTISAPFQNLKLLLTSAAMRRIPPLLAALAVVVLGVLGSAASAQAHEERQTRELDGTGSVPVYRTSGPTLLVCKTDKTDFENRISKFSDTLRAANEAMWDQCQTEGFRHLQAAVDAVKLPGTTIKILPGIYQEDPSVAEPSAVCADTMRNAPKGKVYTEFPILTLDQEIACPNLINLVAVINKKNLQIEGT